MLNKLLDINLSTSISLVRHGQVKNPLGIYYGNLPGFGIDNDGILQAKAAAQILNKNTPTVIFSSPLLRARQTALIIQSKFAYAPLRISNLLKEVKTPFDGCQQSELEKRNWDLYSDVPLGYEQPIDILARIRKFMFRTRRQYFGQNIVAVTHGDVIAFMLLWAQTSNVNLKFKQDLKHFGCSDNYPAPGSISTFFFKTKEFDESPNVEYINPFSYEKPLHQDI